MMILYGEREKKLSNINKLDQVYHCVPASAVITITPKTGAVSNGIDFLMQIFSCIHDILLHVTNGVAAV